MLSIAICIFICCILWGIKLRPKYERENFFSLDTSNILKGIFCVFIIFHHLAQGAENANILTLPFEYLGYAFVGIFLFISGYGLTFGWMKKCSAVASLKELHKAAWGGVKKRLTSLYIPYWSVTILWIIYGFASGNAYSIKRIVIAAVGGYSFSTLWYVTALIIFTIVFYIIFRNGINKISLLKMSVALLIYIIICLQLPTVAWTASTSLFYLGILFAIYRDKVILSIEKNYILWIFASALVFIAGFGSKALLDSVGMTGKTIQVIPRNAIAVGFVSTTLLILYKIKPGNGIIRFFSKISYEIYMLQFLMIEIFYRYLELKWYVLPVLFFTVFCAILLKPLNDKVLRVVRNKADIVKLRN